MLGDLFDSPWKILIVAIVIIASSLSAMTVAGPRVYFAMAEDGLFFRGVAKVSAGTRVPVVAIILQGVAAAVIALSGSGGWYDIALSCGGRPGFQKRFAGRVETGSPSITDPFMGRTTGEKPI